MDMALYMRVVIALLLVLSLVGLIALLARKWLPQISGISLPSAKANRLSVRTMKIIDAKHKLVIVRRDNVEHLLLLGTTTSHVIERNIPVADAPQVTANA